MRLQLSGGSKHVQSVTKHTYAALHNTACTCLSVNVNVHDAVSMGWAAVPLPQACLWVPPCQMQSHGADADSSSCSSPRWLQQQQQLAQLERHAEHAGRSPTAPWQGHGGMPAQLPRLQQPLLPPLHLGPYAPCALAAQTAAPAALRATAWPSYYVRAPAEQRERHSPHALRCSTNHGTLKDMARGTAWAGVGRVRWGGGQSKSFTRPGAISMGGRLKSEHIVMG